MIKAMRRFIRSAGNQVETDRPAKGTPPLALRDFMLWCLNGGWRVVWIGVAISVLAGVVEVLSMYLLGAVVDAVDQTPEGAFLAQHGGLVLVSLIVLLILRPLFFGGLALTQSVMIGPNIYKLVLARLYRWTMGQSVTFFDNDFAGRIAQKEVQTSNSLTEIVVETVNAITFGLATVLGTAVLLGAMSFWMALVLVVWFAGYIVFLRLMLPIIRSRSAARAEARAGVTGQIVDTISNVKTVKLFAGAAHEDTMAIGAMETLRQKALTFGEVQTAFRFGLIFIAGILPVAMVGIAIGMRSNGITPGDVAAAGAITIRLSQMTGWISYTLMSIYSHLGEVENGMQTIAPSNRIEDAAGVPPIRVSQGRIEFDKVSFAYGRKVGGVDQINLTIAPGEKVAIVGASGAGKSTLLNLLLRLYDTEAGHVRIDGQDIATVEQESLREQIGMVTQETAMFNRTAMDNIRYGRTDATDAAVIAAAKRAEAHDFIEGLQDHKGRRGYGAFLGERGVKLSGGQRQRIALARAILKDAPILVLDEATSALDSEVEAAIQETLGQVMQGKTVIAIAHRLSTIAAMDRIIVLDDGKIAEQGNHRELLDQNGLYTRYWTRQSGGFIDVSHAAE
ncbi:MAG: ABC transporter ATP-binding protein [Pseudomonadota bacterium]